MILILLIIVAIMGFNSGYFGIDSEGKFFVDVSPINLTPIPQLLAAPNLPTVEAMSTQPSGNVVGLVEYTPTPFDDLQKAQEVFEATLTTTPMIVRQVTKGDLIAFASIMQQKVQSKELDLSVVYTLQDTVGVGLYGRDSKNIFGNVIDNVCVGAITQADWYAGYNRSFGNIQINVTATHRVQTATQEGDVIDEMTVTIPWGMIGPVETLNPNDSLQGDPDGLPGKSTIYYELKGFTGVGTRTVDLFTGGKYSSRYNEIVFERSLTISMWDTLCQFSLNGGVPNPSQLNQIQSAVLERLQGELYTALLDAANQAAETAKYLPGENGRFVPDIITIKLDGPYYLETLGDDQAVLLSPPNVVKLTERTSESCTFANIGTSEVQKIINSAPRP